MNCDQQASCRTALPPVPLATALWASQVDTNNDYGTISEGMPAGATQMRPRRGPDCGGVKSKATEPCNILAFLAQNSEQLVQRFLSSVEGQITQHRSGICWKSALRCGHTVERSGTQSDRTTDGSACGYAESLRLASGCRTLSQLCSRLSMCFAAVNVPDCSCMQLMYKPPSVRKFLVMHAERVRGVSRAQFEETTGQIFT